MFDDAFIKAIQNTHNEHDKQINENDNILIKKGFHIRYNTLYNLLIKSLSSLYSKISLTSMFTDISLIFTQIDKGFLYLKITDGESATEQRFELWYEEEGNEEIITVFDIFIDRTSTHLFTELNSFKDDKIYLCQ